MKLNHNSVSYGIATVEDLELIESPLEGDTVVVTEEGRGGVFIYRADGTSNGGTIFDSSSTGKWHRQYEGSVNVKWFGAKGDGVTDNSIILQHIFSIIEDNTVLEFNTGIYLYTPTLIDAENTSGIPVTEEYLKISGKNNITIIGYGAIIKPSFVVTYAQWDLDRQFGLYLHRCNDVTIKGITFDGNRDITYGSNVDHNEFFNGLAIRACTNTTIEDSIFKNCQGDGILCIGENINNIYTYNYNTTITNCTVSRNRRNNISVTGDYSNTISNCYIEEAGYGQGTSPMAGIDYEWEYIDNQIIGNNCGHICNGNTFKGVMNGGDIYIYKTSGVTISSNTSIGANQFAAIDGTSSLYSRNILFMGNNINANHGFNITGYINDISITNNTFRVATAAFDTNASNSTARIVFKDNVVNGEANYAFKVLAGECVVENNLFTNCGNYNSEYMLYCRSKCIVENNVFNRNNDQVRPNFYFVFSNANSKFIGNSVNGEAPVIKYMVFGDNNVKAVIKSINNLVNGSELFWSIPDTQSFTTIYTPEVNLEVSTKQVLIGFVGDYPTIIDAGFVNTTNRTANTSISIGTFSAPTYFMPSTAIDTGSGANNVINSFTVTEIPQYNGLFVTPTPTAGAGKVQFKLTMYKYRNSMLYTHATQFN